MFFFCFYSQNLENKLRLKTKRRIEESNFIRLPKTKKEKGGNRSASESNTLGSILSGITAGRNRGNRIAAKGKKRQTKNASR